MFNSELRVTENVNKALQIAGTIAIQYGYYQVGTEHLLYGISALSDTVSGKILNTYGVTPDKLEQIFDKTAVKKNLVVSGSTIELSPRNKEVFSMAKKFAIKVGHNFISTEHLLAAMLLSESSYAVNILKRNFKINLNDLKGSIVQVLKAGTFDGQQTVGRGDNFVNQMGESALPKELLEMGQDLTLKARQGKIDPIIGREEEINRVIQILCRKTKNNPVLIGEAGVGKSAVVDGLALAIAQGKVPEILKNKSIFSLELGGLMAGTKFRGSLEEKLKSLIDIITQNRDIIVFIDEIHTLAQAGGEKGEVNPSDMLKPYLARGEFQTIGATTTDEYRQYIEKDKALERRFQPVIINPPTVEQTIEILRGLKDSFEAFHKVSIGDDAIIASATLSDRYIPDRSLPDKAIDLIDEASSKAKVYGSQKPEEITKIEEEIAGYEAEKREALLNEKFEKASEFRDKIKEANARKEKILAQKQSQANITITSEDICTIISKWTGIPITKLTESEKERLLKLESILHNRVIGQDEAVSAVSKAIRRARIGLKDANRPIGSFMFLGPTGVGKTELCKALAEAMFDNENAVIRIDMSEYMEKHSVSKLIGAPPGYVGFDEGGQLTEQVRRKPYSVVLFDEIEKAHPDVFNLLLQVLDDGRLTDSQGRLVSFKNTIIIFTSNCGVSELPRNKNGLGFNDIKDAVNEDMTKSILMDALKRTFKPEFLNRIDVITVFHSLTQEQLVQICKIFISKLNKKLQEQGVSLKVTESALKYTIDKGFDPEYGARPLRRLIEQEIEDRIAEEMLEGNVLKGDTIIISAKNDKLLLNVER